MLAGTIWAARAQQPDALIGGAGDGLWLQFSILARMPQLPDAGKFWMCEGDFLPVCTAEACLAPKLC